MATLASKHFTPPYQIQSVTFAAGATTGALAVVQNKFHSLISFDRPVYILGMTCVRATGSADASLTLTAGYASAPEGTATPVGSATADANINFLDLTIIDDSVAAPDDMPVRVPAKSIVGFTTSNNAVTNCKLSQVIVKYRYI
jgi:hypothetical protein